MCRTREGIFCGAAEVLHPAPNQETAETRTRIALWRDVDDALG